MSTAESGMWSPPWHEPAKSTALDQDPTKWLCKHCSKTSYVDQMRAWQAIGAIIRLGLREGRPNKRKPCRVYACPYGEGYHLTSKFEERK